MGVQDCSDSNWRQLICRVTVVLCVTPPDVPLNVSVWAPVPALCATVMVTVAWDGFVPSRVTVDGEIAHVVPPGRPLQASETLPVSPPRGVMVMV